MLILIEPGNYHESQLSLSFSQTELTLNFDNLKIFRILIHKG